METTVILEILRIAMMHGIPAVQAALKAIDKEKITLTDVKEIQALVKKPEYYFR